jgi:hypothetical protein
LGPPTCVEAQGLVTGTTGVLRGFNGTFMFHDDGSLILLSG